jgi:chromosome segregation ATPase
MNDIASDTRNLASKVSKLSGVMSALELAAQQLANQHRDDAKAAVAGIQGDLLDLSSLADQYKSEVEKQQAAATQTIKDVTKNEAEARNNLLAVSNHMSQVTSDIAVQNVKMNDLQRDLQRYEGEAADTLAELRAHQARLDELNDTSAASIIQSIFSLGIDRAVEGIQSLINDDQGKINSLRPVIERLEASIRDIRAQLDNSQQLLRALEAETRRLTDQVGSLQLKLHELHSALSECRDRAASLTVVALFFGRVIVVAREVDHRIDDVNDIIAELKSDKATIAQFEGSEQEMLSLKQALQKFKEFLLTGPE